MKTRYSRSEDEDAESRERIVAEISAEALHNNYEVIRGLAPGQSILPMIKANAYGHGAGWAARQLAHAKALYGFGVATLEEGAEIRRALTDARKRGTIVVCSGAAPWTEEKGQFCEKHGLTPAIARDEDWHSFLRGGWTDRISFELKFNTGMNRLGLSAGLAGPIARALKDRPSGHHPRGVFTHLAMGEAPDAKLSRRQRELFIGIRGELAGALPSAHFHIANSSAIWSSKQWQLDDLSDVVRPGISLYGVPPWVGAPPRGLLPVMTLRARVIAVHQLKRGESIGYGATFKAEEEPVDAAVLSAGYADGVHRALSNRGFAWLGGRAERVIGIVSMDLSAVSCTPRTRVGEWAELLGPNVDVWAQAHAAATIPYELLTSVSPRVKKVYS